MPRWGRAICSDRCMNGIPGAGFTPPRNTATPMESFSYRDLLRIKMPGIRHCIIHIVIPVILLSFPVLSQADGSDRVPKIKAAYVHQFSHFVSWPDEAAETARDRKHLILCIFGDDRVTHYLERLAGHGHGAFSIEISHPASPSQLRHCELLYITPSQEGELQKVLVAVADLPVLTISDMPGFIDRGGMIGFVVRGDRVRLEINLQAAQRVRLHISAKLIEVSLRVITVHAREAAR